MNLEALKRYGAAARLDFLKAVRERLACLDAGGPLQAEIEAFGVDAVLERYAYTWFNRFAALRYLEVNGYLPFRVLSAAGSRAPPELLSRAGEVSFGAGFDQKHVQELLRAGNREEDLYRYLLLAECHELHASMPCLFQEAGDISEELLPHGLLSTDSLLKKLVGEIEEDEWRRGVEIIGWLYQYYISDRKSEVIGRVVATQDIPVATQIFTPRWIVRYLLQNSLGRLWLDSRPDSGLRAEMEYYLPPCESTPVSAERALRPEEIKLIDPACGSGHMLVEAYDLFEKIYLEYGYRRQEVPGLILRHNLYGLDIDPRAVQLTSFALLMRASRDNKHLIGAAGFELNVAVLEETGGFELEKIGMAEEMRAAVHELVALFENARDFGSLIVVPQDLKTRLPELSVLLEAWSRDPSPGRQSAAARLKPLVRQAGFLSQEYDVVVTNPPYMGERYLNPALRVFARQHYPLSKMDLFAMFMEKAVRLAGEGRYAALVVMESWMFLGSFEKLRKELLRKYQVTNLLHLDKNVMKIAFGTSAFVLQTSTAPDRRGAYTLIATQDLDGEGKPYVFPVVKPDSKSGRHGVFRLAAADFLSIPGAPLAYWIGDDTRAAFRDGAALGDLVEIRQGLATGDNDRFLRRWYEVDFSKIGFGFCGREEAGRSGKKWFPYNKGGQYRNWYGNNEYVVNWQDDGREIRSFGIEGKKLRSRPQNMQYYFKPGLTWTFLSASRFGVRWCDPGFIFDVAGSMVFPPAELRYLLLGFLASRAAFEFLKVLNPTVNFQVGNLNMLPFLKDRVPARRSEIEEIVKACIEICREDWNERETSWDFKQHPLLMPGIRGANLGASLQRYESHKTERLSDLARLEAKNSAIFDGIYGRAAQAQDADENSAASLALPQRSEIVRSFLSYFVGCALGRYSLSSPGLIRAACESGGEPPSEDGGILPLGEHGWPEYDAVAKLEDFLNVLWGREALEDNLRVLAVVLEAQSRESARVVIRRYLAAEFYKDHLTAYHKRPVYWLITSGSRRALQVLVYMPRFTALTLSQIRTACLLPLQARFHEAAETQEMDNAPLSAAQRARRRDMFKECELELTRFDEVLHAYADMKIELDLDAGVRANCRWLRPLLAHADEIC